MEAAAVKVISTLLSRSPSRSDSTGGEVCGTAVASPIIGRQHPRATRQLRSDDSGRRAEVTSGNVESHS